RLPTSGLCIVSVPRSCFRTRRSSDLGGPSGRRGRPARDHGPWREHLLLKSIRPLLVPRSLNSRRPEPGGVMQVGDPDHWRRDFKSVGGKNPRDRGIGLPRPGSVPVPCLDEPRAETAREVTMGREIDQTEFTRGQRTHYRRELRRNLDLFESFLDTAEFIDEGTVGVELEMNLAESEGMAPALLADAL